MSQQLRYGHFIIEIYDITADLSKTAQTMKYNGCYCFENFAYPETTRYGIRIDDIDDKLSKHICIAASGGKTNIHEYSHVLNNESIAVCCADSVFCLHLPGLELKWKIKADDASCFGIFKYENGYIVHGELAITRLDDNGKILWQFLSDDSFTTKSGKDNFRIEKDCIYVTDWQNVTFKLNADTGKIENTLINQN